MNTKIITIDKLADILMNINTPTLAKILSETIPGMKKTNNPYYEGTVKLSEKNVQIAFNYTEAVNINRALEGKDFDFVAKPRKWGQRIGTTSIISHNGMMYVEARLLKNLETHYFHNGQEIDKSVLTEVLNKPSSSKTQDLENEIIVNDFKLNSIRQIQLNDTLYTIR